MARSTSTAPRRRHRRYRDEPDAGVRRAPDPGASDRAALRLLAVWAVGAAGLLAVPGGPFGVRVLAAVVAWHVAVVGVAARRRDPAWRSAYALVAPMSVLLVLPDQFLAAGLHTLVFPDPGVPLLGAVPVFMAGMWAIPLAVVVFVGRAAERRRGPAWGVAAGAVLGLAVFAAAEAATGVLPLWRAVGVPAVGPVALYVLPAEALLSATTVLADQIVRGRSSAVKALASALVVLAYTGGLAVGWLALGR